MIRTRVAAIAAAACLIATASLAQTACPVSGSGQCSASVGSTPVQLTANGPRRYQRLVNGSSGTTAWCTRDSKVTAAVNGAGSFPIAAGSEEEYSTPTTGYVPSVATFCVAPTGSTIPFAVEVN